MKLNLDDLIPKEATFYLSDTPDIPRVLKKYTLRDTIWVNQQFGEENVQGIFKDTRIGDISEIVYHLLKDKAQFPTLGDFQDAILTNGDRVAVVQAMLTTLGISQPVMDAATKNEPAPSQDAPTGAQSLT